MLSLVPHDKLCVEITEQQFFGDGRDLKERLAILRQAGVRIALDDVGFGRTSLELLILLEPDIVKIDRRFVKGVSTDPLQAAAFRRLVEAVNALGAVIVAEGIETPDDRSTVQQFGVPYGQGFLWRSDVEQMRAS
jgi:EAL domain-containing protein (putative c-di-GMP-specific phosphodiesterase class I)